MAITSTPLAACRTFSAAPLPRPPQPIRPTLMVSPPAAWTPPVASRVAVAAAADVLRNWRREVWLFLLICCEPPGSEGRRLPAACGLAQQMLSRKRQKGAASQELLTLLGHF